MLEKYENIGSALFEKFAHQKSGFAALSLMHQNFIGFIVISRIVFNIFSKRFLPRALILCESCRTKHFFY